MAGIDEILSMIDAQQKQTGDNIIAAAERKAASIEAEGKEKAEKAFSDYIKKSHEQLEREYENACSSADAEMKRRILSRKVECIDEVIEKALTRLDQLPAAEYFSVIENLISKRLSAGEGILSFSRRDLERVPESFMKNVSASAEKVGGTVKLSDTPADIENGFVLTYGLISENCSFRAIMEAEREGVRDTAARALFR